MNTPTWNLKLTTVLRRTEATGNFTLHSFRPILFVVVVTCFDLHGAAIINTLQMTTFHRNSRVIPLMKLFSGHQTSGETRVNGSC